MNDQAEHAFLLCKEIIKLENRAAALRRELTRLVDHPKKTRKKKTQAESVRYLVLATLEDGKTWPPESLAKRAKCDVLLLRKVCKSLVGEGLAEFVGNEKSVRGKSVQPDQGQS